MLSLKGKNMSSIRPVYVPGFGSQLGSGQRDKLQLDQTEPPSQWQGRRRGKRSGGVKVRGEKTRFVLKVKFPKLNSRTLPKKVTQEEETPRRWTLESATDKAKTPVSREGETPCAGIDSVGEHFFFSQRETSKTINEKEKAKLAVLRTISKMLEENHLIRQRLAAHSQTN